MVTQAKVTEFPKLNGTLGRKLRVALIGGGMGAFIGQHHWRAALLTGRAELVAGAFSDDKPDLAKGMAEFYDISPDRAYTSSEEMLRTEAKKPDECPDVIVIAAPNFRHFELAKLAIELGFNVVCEKPLTMTVEEAEKLEQMVVESGVAFAVAHGYTCFPTAILAREIIRSGKLGKVRAVRAQYIQGWLATKLEDTGQQQATWRTDPKRTGKGAAGDILTHAADMAHFMTGLTPTRLRGQLHTFVPGRQVDDYATCTMMTEKGVIIEARASQISVNRKNDLEIEVDCEKGSLRWSLEDPDTLEVNDETGRHIYKGDAGEAGCGEYKWFQDACWWPGGHNEGLHNAWANLLKWFYDDVVARAEGGEVDNDAAKYPNVHRGVLGMRVIDAIGRSSEEDCGWVEI